MLTTDNNDILFDDLATINFLKGANKWETTLAMDNNDCTNNIHDCTNNIHDCTDNLYHVIEDAKSNTSKSTGITV